MNKRKLFMSFFTLIFSILLLITATFAWFSIDSSSSINIIELTAKSNLINSYDIYFYTEDNVYRYNFGNSKMQIYDNYNAKWVDVIENSNDPYKGLMMKPYDFLFSDNNLNNNMIIELHLKYTVDKNTDVSLFATSNPSLAVKNLPQSNPLYLSRYTQLQVLVTDEYANRTDGNNLFSQLNNQFLDITNLPFKNFYNNDTALDSITLKERLTLTTNNELFLYINFTYFKEQIDKLIISKGEGTQIINSVYFLQDIAFLIK